MLFILGLSLNGYHVYIYCGLDHDTGPFVNFGNSSHFGNIHLGQCPYTGSPSKSQTSNTWDPAEIELEMRYSGAKRCQMPASSYLEDSMSLRRVFRSIYIPYGDYKRTFAGAIWSAWGDRRLLGCTLEVSWM